ncbi:hypothetical protein FB446DRAFT_704519 [Lentinula raphanica]|nr:hypothetical protein FB446DRAFT_704519 [Lentinula raphanica]
MSSFFSSFKVSSSRRNISSDAKVALGATKIALSSTQSFPTYSYYTRDSTCCRRLLKIIQPLSENSATDSLSESQTDRIQTLMTALNEVLTREQRIRHQGLLKRLLLQEDIQTAILNMNQKIKNALDAFTLESNNTQERTTAKTHDNVEGLVITTNANTAEIQEVGKQVGQLTEGVVEIKTANQTCRGELLSKAQRELINSLPHAPARYNAASRSSASSCLEGTRIDLLRTIHANDVMKPRIFWLGGLAGTGKSTIAQTIAKELDTSHNLAWHSLAEAIEADPDAGELTVMHTQLKKLIIEPLQSLNNPPDRQIVVVIDALDECSDRKLAQDILILFAENISTLPLPLAIFITSHSEMYRLIFLSLCVSWASK